MKTATLGHRQAVLEWPYPIRYHVENEVSADVLILGGGIAGCWAAISAARKGARAVILEKGATIRSGSGGTGCDHWQHACTNPCSKVTPEEMTNAVVKSFGEYACGITRYIRCEEAYDTALELEKMGVKIRDTEGEFEGAEFRDEETKFLFAYDYENKYSMRIWGTGIKPALYNECKRLGVEIYDRVMVTSLLTEGGERGARVVGATGVNVRTGEFYIFRAKATVSCLGTPERLWAFSMELRGFASSFLDPNCAGEGYDIGWRAGAEFALMEESRPEAGGFGYPSYGVGNPDNTWYACTIVDANGKEVPWVNRDGKVLKTVSERYRPAPGQKFFLIGTHTPTHGGTAALASGASHPAWYEHKAPCLIPDLPERIKKGEFVLPLYADLPSMPEHERRAIFGLMVAQEGKTLIPVYYNYTQAGFDPDKDLLQAPVFPPEGYARTCFWLGMPVPQWRNVAFCSGGGVIVDWDLKTNLEGLYAAGAQALGGSDHVGAATSGRYAGRRAADYALKAAEPVVDRKQVEEEKARVYAPVKRKDGVEWKELNAGIGRVMQDYCGDYKSEESLKIGLIRLNEVREGEAATAYARNPHELMRVLECLSLLNVGEMTMHASLARKASSSLLNFKRLDYPEVDPPEWNKFTTIKSEHEKVKYGELPLNYWLLSPNALTYKENYEVHCGL
jgi:succinate dehydrogenase/fumarate reductase flavoprotein subunit